MSEPRDAKPFWPRRIAQFCLDPLAVAVPGWNRLMMAIGPGRAGPDDVTPARLGRGLVLLLPGIEGPSFYTSGIRAGLRRAGLAAAVRIDNWAGTLPGTFYALTRVGSRRRAGRLLGRIDRYRGDHPGRPVVLVGHSGGAAIAVLTAELAGRAGRPITGAIAVAPALSPGYDLSAALGGLERELVACHSRMDLQLRFLTTMGGNFDRRYGRTAGQEGFNPAAARAEPQRLVQIAWDRSMIADGHLGGHVGWTRPRWVARHLGPIVQRWMGEACAAE